MFSSKFDYLLFVLGLCWTSATPTTYECDPSAACGCSRRPAVLSKIVGGETAMNQTWGWAVSLLLDETYMCGGSIISDSWVLTAAHCTFNLTANKIYISAASNTVFAWKQMRVALQVIIHPGYNDGSVTNDISLIRVYPPFNMTDENIAKICLPSSTNFDFPLPGSAVTVIGWGRLSTNGPTSTDLQQVTLRRIALFDRRCRTIITDLSSQICAMSVNETKDSCYGDSGGPLMSFADTQQWVVTGVVSYGSNEGCATPNYAGIYTRVAHYVDWIRSMNVTDIVTVADVVMTSTSTSTSTSTTTTTTITTTSTNRQSTTSSQMNRNSMKYSLIFIMLIKILISLF